MSFFEEIGNALGVDWAKLALGYQIVDYNGEALYIEGVRRIVRIGEDGIALEAGKSLVEIEGESLRVVDLSGAAVMVRGTVAAVRVQKTGEADRVLKQEGASAARRRRKA